MILITLDIDWAPDFIIKKVDEMLKERNIKSTWFVTHKSAHLKNLSKNRNYELGIHPNFLPNTTQGKTPKEILESCSANRTIQGSGGNENSKAKEYNNSGVAAAKNGMFSEAIKYFNKALEENPQYYDAISNLGTCKHALKDIEGACSDWRKAAEYGDPYAIQMLSKYCK